VQKSLTVQILISALLTGCSASSVFGRKMLVETI
jgi:hypothetical protein